MTFDRMADTGGYKCLFTWYIQLHKMSSKLHAQPCAKRLIQYILFISESSAYVRFDDADLSPVNAKRLPNYTPDNVRDLCGCHHFDPVSLHFRITDKIFDVTMLNSRRTVPSLNFDQSRFLDRFLIISFLDRRMFQYIIRIFFMDLRRSVFHGFHHIQYERIFFVFHLDCTKRLRCGDLVFCHDRRNVVSVKSYTFCQNKPICHILMALIC